MSLLVPDQLTQNLHETNSRLSASLDRLSPRPDRSETQMHPVTPQQMAGLLSELMRAGQWLRELPVDRDLGLEQELSEYRKNVERLRKLLPSIHGTLLRERARLEQERARVESAAQWAHRSRETF